jgi:hypothetical protein
VGDPAPGSPVFSTSAPVTQPTSNQRPRYEAAPTAHIRFVGIAAIPCVRSINVTWLLIHGVISRWTALLTPNRMEWCGATRNGCLYSPNDVERLFEKIAEGLLDMGL